MPQVCFFYFPWLFLCLKTGRKIIMEILLEQRHENHVDEKEEVAVTSEMAFVVDHGALMNALTICGKVIPKSSAIPIMQTIKFDLNGDTLFITAVDVSQSVLQMMEVKNTGGVKGSYLFPAKEGIELIKRLPAGSLTLTRKESSVHVQYGKSGKANLSVLDSDEFPALPVLGKTDMIPISLETLRRAAVTSLFTATDEKTPALNGIHIYNHEGKLGFQATDRHRISRFVSDIPIDTPETFLSSIVPAQNFKQIVDSLKDSVAIQLAVTSTYLILRDKNIVYFGRLIDATFPDLSVAFKGIDQGITITLSKEELDKTLYRALSLDAQNNRVTLEVDTTGEFVVHTQSKNSALTEGFPTAILDANASFPVMKFNGKYLREALLLGNRETKNVQIRVSSSKSPGYLTLEGDPSVTAVLLPCL